MNKRLKSILSTVDLLNTLSGGVSEPYLSYREETGGRQLRIRVPGVSKELLNVEIRDNQLTVYYHISMETSGKQEFFPKEVVSQTLPYFIEIPAIEAGYQGNELVITLPYNELSNGYNRNVPIAE